MLCRVSVVKPCSYECIVQKTNLLCWHQPNSEPLSGYNVIQDQLFYAILARHSAPFPHVRNKVYGWSSCKKRERSFCFEPSTEAAGPEASLSSGSRRFPESASEHSFFMSCKQDSGFKKQPAMAAKVRKRKKGNHQRTKGKTRTGEMGNGENGKGKANGSAFRIREEQGK